MADTYSPMYPDAGLSQEEVADRRQRARDFRKIATQYPGGGGLGALAMALAGYQSGSLEREADTGGQERRALGQKLMQEFNAADRPSPLVSTLAGGQPQPSTSGAPALASGPGSMPLNGSPPLSSGATPAATAVPSAPALAGPRPDFAATPGALNTEKERRQEAILARAATMEGPVGDWARQQLTFANQKKLAFGLEHEKAQIQKQLGLETAQEQQKQTINDMITMEILTPEQGRQALARMASQSGAPASPSPSAPAGPALPSQATGVVTPPAKSIPGLAVDNSTAPARPPAVSASAVPLTPGGQMPPGTRPSGLPAQDDMTAAMPALSENAQRAQKMIQYGMIKGNRAMVQAGNDLLKADPTQEARVKQAEKMGVNAANLAERRRAGTNVEKTFDHFQDVANSMYTQNKDAFDNSIGRLNNNDIFQTARSSTLGKLPFNTYQQAADNHNRMNHLIDGLTTAFMSSAAGSGLQMSDSRMAKFEETMGAMRRASSKKEFDGIMTDARKIIRDVFSLDQGRGAVPSEQPTVNANTPAPSPSVSPSPARPAAADFDALPSHEKRSALADLAKDMTPTRQAQFRSVFGDKGLQAALSIIAEQKQIQDRAVRAPAMPNPLSNFDESGRFVGPR